MSLVEWAWTDGALLAGRFWLGCMVLLVVAILLGVLLERRKDQT